MKKFFAALIILLIAVGAFAQFAVPKALTNYLKDLVGRVTATQEISLKLDSLPAAKMAVGYVDSLHCETDDATIGDLKLKQAVLDGSAIHVNIKEIIFPTDGISREEHTNRCLHSAGSLELSGIITAEALQNFLGEKVSQLREPKVTMSPEGITAAAKVKILGRDADVQIGGQIIAREGDLYLHMTHINIENAILRRVNLDKFIGDINLTQSVRMPFGLQFRSVEMRQDEAFVKATRN